MYSESTNIGLSSAQLEGLPAPVIVSQSCPALRACPNVADYYVWRCIFYSVDAGHGFSACFAK